MLEALCIVYVQALTCVGPSVWVFFIYLLLFFYYFVSVFTVLSLVTCLDRPM